MLFQLSDNINEDDSGETKISPNELDTINYNQKQSKILQNSHIQSSSASYIKLTRKVLSSKALLEHILSYIPIDSLLQCSRVCSNWYLIIKYLVPISLIHLRPLSVGELVYWLPGENQFPKTVLLKLRFSSGKPKFLEIITKIKKNQNKLKNGNNNNNNHNKEPELTLTAGHYQMLDLSEILFIIDGHWTPIFEYLTFESNNNDNIDVDETQFFHRSKCFSIVTNTYMTYDFITFNKETNESIVNTIRSIINQNHIKAKNMAIHAKANKKYQISNIGQTIIFNDTLQALNFEMFVLILEDCKNKIGLELNIDIPTIITTELNASMLYPLLLEQNIIFSEWFDWSKQTILEVLRLYGYIKEDLYGSEIDAYDVNDNDNELLSNNINIMDEKDNEDIDNKDDDDDNNKNNEKHTKSDKPHNRRQSSLFGLNAFPIDESYDLFSGIRNSDDEDEDDDDDIYDDNEYKSVINKHSINENNTNDNTEIVTENNKQHNIDSIDDPNDCMIM